MVSHTLLGPGLKWYCLSHLLSVVVCEKLRVLVDPHLSSVLREFVL